VRLKSRDPRVAPLIDYNLLGDAHVRRRLLEGVKLARRIGRTAPLRELIDREVSPSRQAASDEALASEIEGNLDTYHHGSSTAPMGPKDDGCSVVDGSGRVHNVQHLWVVDASIFPEIPSTPTNLTTIMLAERIAARAFTRDR
jgi:choline dehydrogenase